MSETQHARSFMTALLAALFLTISEASAQPAVHDAAAPAAEAPAGALVATVARPEEADVVGSVEGEPLYGSDVAVYLRPAPPRVGAARPPDPRMAAAESAIRNRLLAREAKRRGFRAVGSKRLAEASLVQGLVGAELKRRGVSVERVRDSEARQWYESHREPLAALQSVELSAIVLDAPDAAEALLERSERATDEEFAALVARHSVDKASREQGGRFATIDGEGAGAEAAVVAVARWLRRAGAVGLARGSDGRSYVLRATRVQMKVPEWDESMAARARNFVFQRQREELVEALAAPLRKAARVELDAVALGRLRVPTEEERWSRAVGGSQGRDFD